MKSAALQAALRKVAEREGSLDSEPTLEVDSEPGYEPLLGLAAVVWLIDSETFQLIASRLGPPRNLLSELTARRELDPVPRLPDTWRIRDDLRIPLAQAWMREAGAEAVTALLRDLARIWTDRARAHRADPAISLHFRAQIPGEDIGPDLNQLFLEAEKQFALDRCRQLLELVSFQTAFPGNALDLAQHIMAVAKVTTPLVKRLAARSYFANDWYKTVRYYRRETLHDTLATFLGEAGKERWLLPIYAAGGTGKTMLLRSWIARELVPAGIPVARIDFDFTNWRHLDSAPWLILLPIAEQLKAQWIINPYARFGSFRDDWAPWLQMDPHGSDTERHQPQEAQKDPNQRDATSARFAHDFAESLPDKQTIVLIFDTTEEPYLHWASEGEDRQLPGALPAILKFFEILHPLRPNVRVVLSGRYDLFARRAQDGRERIPGLAAKFGEFRQPSMEIRGFNRTETDQCLYDCWKLELSEDVRAAIFEKSEITEDAESDRSGESEVAGTQAADQRRALPFDVDFWAREAATKEGLTADTIRNAPGLHYAIERVLVRIARPDIQWLVRYAIVPRRLTTDFLRDVLLEPLRREVNLSLDDATRRDRGKAPLVQAYPQWQLKRLWEVGVPVPETIDRLWRDLLTYAAGPDEGWLEVRMEPGGGWQMKLHLRVVGPMRRLLEDEDVWPELQERAQKFFLDRAALHLERGDTSAWAREAAEAIFHAYQQSSEKGETLYERLLSEAQCLPWGARRILLEMVVGDAGFQAGESRVPLRDRERRRKVALRTELVALDMMVICTLWQSVLTIHRERRDKLRAVALRWFNRLGTAGLSATTDADQATSQSYLYSIGLSEDGLLTEKALKFAADYDTILARVESGTSGWNEAEKERIGFRLLYPLAIAREKNRREDPSSWTLFDAVAKRMTDREESIVPKSAVAALAAIVAADDGQTGVALDHWAPLVNGEPQRWAEAGAWLECHPSELKLACARDHFDASCSQTAEALAQSLAPDLTSQVPQNPRPQLTHRPEIGPQRDFGSLALILTQEIDLRVRRAPDPEKVTRIESLARETESDIGIRTQALLILAALAEQNLQFDVAAGHFETAGNVLRSAGLENAACGVATLQAIDMLFTDHIREARIALDALPLNGSPSQRRMLDPWPIRAVTAELLLRQGAAKSEQSAPEREGRTLPPNIYGRGFNAFHAELLAAQVAAGSQCIDELLARLNTTATLSGFSIF